MNTLSYKTISANSATANKEWVIVDANGEILGRLASKVAKIIRGKYKTNFTPHADCGDNVIVINSEKIRLTGDKWNQREHFSHSGYPGGQKITTPAQMLAKNPALIVESAVRGMLPKNRLGRKIFKNLHVIVGNEHKFEAQKPKEINLNTLK
ncbi:MAG: 50S ribosomal protein L13 [Bacteroidales bacterium]|nr:50S ribosomal protein L13 [Bacteroidales bacterium]MBN2757868.1 50S ribosomal protein L13 [Bacteroidales bacterium]